MSAMSPMLRARTLWARTLWAPTLSAAFRSGVALAVALTLAISVPRRELRGEPGDLVEFVPFSVVSPQDIAPDTDGTYWISAFLSNTVHHYSADLSRELGVFDAPVPAGGFVSGLAFNSLNGTLLVAEVGASTIVEVERDGTPTGLTIPLALEPVVNPNGFPTARGLAFWEGGDGGNGSIFVVESVGTLIYEVSLDGRVLRTFSHPDDPDGFPGEGASAQATDVELIVDEGELRGFYVTGSRRGRPRITKLDADGNYTGLSISLSDAGGNVSGLLRRTISPAGESIDAFICVVESSARFALLEGGEPDVREIVEFRCTEDALDVELGWTLRQTYDAIEVVRDCDVLATLPGDATEWQTSFDHDDVIDLHLRATVGERVVETAPCRVVVGRGQILAAGTIEADRPIDFAWDGADLLYFTDAFEHQLVVHDLDFEPVAALALTEDVVSEDEAITGIAYDESTERFFVYNNSRHAVSIVDFAGEFHGEFIADLPNLADEPEPGEEPEEDFGVVLGMAFDPRGDADRGSLWLVEAVEDRVYEISLDGARLGALANPYRDLDPVPDDSPFRSFSSGVAVVKESATRRLFLSGGSVTDGGQRFVAQVDVATGTIVRGSEITLRGVQAATGLTSVTLEHVTTAGDEPRLFGLAYNARSRPIVEIGTRAVAPAPIRRLTCRQRDRGGAVALQFEPDGSYDRIEILRDCEPVASLPPDATSFVDASPPPGERRYAVRGVAADQVTSSVECRIEVGPGGILQDAFAWPARSPQQLARDPVDGSYWVAVNWPGDERTLYHYDRNLQFLEERPSALSAPWQIATLAVRVTPDGERVLTSIAWRQPVPLGEAGQETFLLVAESLDGTLLDETAIDPPRPEGGFVTFPAGLEWNPDSQSFWFLERNSAQFVEMNVFGDMLDVFPHPAPPFQNFVFNLGMTYVSERGTLLITGSERDSRSVTRGARDDARGRAHRRRSSGRRRPVQCPRHRVGGRRPRHDRPRWSDETAPSSHGAHDAAPVRSRGTRTSTAACLSPTRSARSSTCSAPGATLCRASAAPTPTTTHGSRSTTLSSCFDGCSSADLPHRRHTSPRASTRRRTVFPVGLRRDLVSRCELRSERRVGRLLCERQTPNATAHGGRVVGRRPRRGARRGLRPERLHARGVRPPGREWCRAGSRALARDRSAALVAGSNQRVLGRLRRHSRRFRASPALRSGRTLVGSDRPFDRATLHARRKAPAADARTRGSRTIDRRRENRPLINASVQLFIRQRTQRGKRHRAPGQKLRNGDRCSPRNAASASRMSSAS